jgi:hypothetical protein
MPFCKFPRRMKMDHHLKTEEVLHTEARMEGPLKKGRSAIPPRLIAHVTPPPVFFFFVLSLINWDSWRNLTFPQDVLILFAIEYLSCHGLVFQPNQPCHLTNCLVPAKALLHLHQAVKPPRTIGPVSTPTKPISSNRPCL